MGDVERLHELVAPAGPTGFARRDVEAHLIALAGVPTIGQTAEEATIFGYRIGIELRDGLCNELVELGLEARGVERCDGLALGANELVLEVGCQESRGGDDARMRRHEDAWNLELERHVAGEQWAGTAGSNEREVAWVVATTHRVDLDVLRHAELLDLQCAECGLLGRHLEFAAEVLHHVASQLGLEGEATTDEAALGAQPAEEDLGVGRGWQGAAAVVTGRAGLGTSRLWADAEDATLIDVRNRAAASTNRVDVDHRHHRLVVADLRIEQVAHAHLAASSHTDVGRGAADVEGDDRVVASHLAGPDATDQTRDGAGHQQVDRAARGRLNGRHAARGLHQLDAVLEARFLHGRSEPLDVRGDLGADEGIEGDGREALIFAIERDHFAGDREEHLGVLLANDLADALLVRVVEVRVQEADSNRLDASALEEEHLASHSVFVERRDDLAVGRSHTLGDDAAVAALDERARLPRQVLLQREVEGLFVACDVENVAKAFGRDHADLSTLVGQRDIGGDGRAVKQVVDLRQLHAGLGAEACDAFDHAASWVVRGRRNLVDGNLAGLLVNEDEVGKCAANVDSNALHVNAPLRFAAKEPALAVREYSVYT